MDIMARYRKSLEEFTLTRDFIKSLSPTEYKLTSILMSLDVEINKAEDMLKSLRGSRSAEHRCDFCDRPYDEEVPVMIESLKICLSCRSMGQKFRHGSIREKEYGLPAGTIKRDCESVGGKPPKLQPFIDVGLVYKSGTHNMVHVRVMELYYANDARYRRRKSRSKG